MDATTDSTKNHLSIECASDKTARDLSKDLLFCKCVRVQTTAEELFKLIDGYVRERDDRGDESLNYLAPRARIRARKYTALLFG